MTRYEHTQPGWPMLLAVTVPLVVLAGAILALDAPLLAPVLLMSIMLVVAALFPSLTVRVSDEAVELHYGIGLIHKSYPLDRVRGARTVRNRWWYGWGIRLTPHGWLFNISGLDAVEIELTSGRRVRIGSDEPERLARAVRAHLGAPR